MVRSTELQHPWPFAQNSVYSFQTQGNKPSQKGRIKAALDVKQGVTWLWNWVIKTEASKSTVQVSALSQGGSGAAGRKGRAHD